MISNRIRNLYLEARKAGSCRAGFAAVDALADAKTLAKWEVLAELGYVRLVARTDEDVYFSPKDFACYCGDRRCQQSEDRIGGVIDSLGAYGVIGQFRTDFDAEAWYPGDTDDDRLPWVGADSVWACIGYRDVTDWRENPYVLDIMAETIRQFRDAWKAHVRHVCPTCRGTGRTPGSPPPEGHDSWADFSHDTQSYQHYNRATGRAERID